ncbi:MAG: hypothetical protein IKJ43_03690 [Bacilli bacterium]|nr:hypothetical protein [Bacilli bacterium]
MIFIILSKEELIKVNGGGPNFTLIGGIGAAIAFLISLVDGFLNPGKC